MAESTPSLLEYYRRHAFNPVPIAVEDRAVWKDHFAKRANLYGRHLGIPLALLRGRRVLEFGCNSGENALVLAAAGAELTLVEPNEQVHPRLHDLFRRFGLTDRIERLEGQGVGQFEADGGYDLVIAEGFLYTLEDRDALLRRLCGFLGPGGLGVVSFNDRYGMVLEQTRRAVLYRACELAGVADPHSAAGLDLARRLYGEEFARLEASRAFEVWWQDTLVNPFLEARWLWSYPEVLPLVEGEGCQFRATSPRWARVDDYRWYKSVEDGASRSLRLRRDWARHLPFFLTGIEAPAAEPAPAAVLEQAAELVARISRYTTGACRIDAVTWPETLGQLLASSAVGGVRAAAQALGRLYAALPGPGAEALVRAWHDGQGLRDLWGAPYHYLSFGREG